LFYPSVEVLLRQLPRAGQRLLEAHRQVFDGLKRGDGASAAEWMTKHIIDFKRGYDVAKLDVERPIGQLNLSHSAE
jgi:DNA-binding GntR family transcriptional regulator